MGHPRPLFRVFLVSFKQILQFLQQIKYEKMSIQYTALRFELTAFRMRVSSHYHYTRAPTQIHSNLPS